MAGSFFAIKCSKCGYWFLQETRKDLLSDVVCKCKHCQKSFKLFLSERKYVGSQAQFFGPYDSQEASKVIQEIKKNEATNNGELWVGELSEFETYELK